MGGVSVALVNWNSLAYIERCLTAVFAQTCSPCDVVVVDNASTDGSKERISQAFPQVKLIENDTNVGFATGCNQAIAASFGAYVLVLNPDVFLEADFIEVMLRGFDAKTGVVTGRVYQEATQEWISGGFFMRRMIRIIPAVDAQDRLEVFGASGALALFRRSALEAVAFNSEYFDPAYFMYGEDIDLAWRLQLLGWTCCHQPGSGAYHIGSGASQGRMRFIDKPALLQRHILKNRYLTVWKNASLRLFLWLFPALVLTEFLLWPYLLVRVPWHFPYLCLALVDAVRLIPWVLVRRRWIKQQRRVSTVYMRRFFLRF